MYVTPRLTEKVARERAEAAGWKPDDAFPFPGVGQKWPGLCISCGNRIAPRLNDAEHRGPCALCGRERQARSQRLSDDVARKRAIEAGWEPFGTYPGNMRTAWPGTCLQCGTVVEPTLDNAVRQGPCRPCGLKKQGMSSRIPDNVARQRARKAGWEPDPDEPYPGSSKAWPGVCLECGTRVQPRLATKNAGPCRECGERKLYEAFRLNDETALNRARAGGFEPTAPYVNSQTPWEGLCLQCGGPVRPLLNNLRRAGPCGRCAAQTRGKKLRLDESVVREQLKPFMIIDDDWTYSSARDHIPGKCRAAGHRITTFSFQSFDPMKGNVCQDCGETGVHLSEPGVFYCVISDDVIKCGISNTSAHSGRLRQHAVGEYSLQTVIFIRYFARAAEAKEVEDQWINHILSDPRRRIGTHREYAWFSDESFSMAIALGESSGSPFDRWASD